MVSVTLAIPQDVKERMDKFTEINWSGFIRTKIIERTEELEWKDQMLKKFEKEKPILDWAVNLQREGRRGRYEELKKQGLLE